MKPDDMLEAFRQMTLLELSEFIKSFEKTFDVKASAPAPIVLTETSDHAEEPDEPDEFDVVLESAGSKKIQVIKEVRTITKLGLKEAKDLVDTLPKFILEKADKDTATKAKIVLENAGAVVVFGPSKQ